MVQFLDPTSYSGSNTNGLTYPILIIWQLGRLSEKGSCSLNNDEIKSYMNATDMLHNLLYYFFKPEDETDITIIDDSIEKIKVEHKKEIESCSNVNNKYLIDNRYNKILYDSYLKKIRRLVLVVKKRHVLDGMNRDDLIEGETFESEG